MTIKTEAVIINRHGGPEVLEHVELDIPEPGKNEIRIHQTAIGLNYADIYQRQGAAGPHGTGALPILLGSVGAGMVESVGEHVHEFQPGDWVCYHQSGAYSATRLVEESRALRLPDDIPPENAAANLVRGMTAEYLLRRHVVVQPGQWMLVHAAAGGMGQILCSWGQALGARVIGTAGSEAKRRLALDHGCEHAINYSEDKFWEAVNDITGGAGVSVVYDAVGRTVFFDSLKCMATHGHIVSYGTASGEVQGLDLSLLHPKSLIVSRTRLRTFVDTRAELQASAGAYFAAVRAGHTSATVSNTFPLSEAARAHTAVESRQTTGSSILVPADRPGD